MPTSNIATAGPIIPNKIIPSSNNGVREYRGFIAAIQGQDFVRNVGFIDTKADALFKPAMDAYPNAFVDAVPVISYNMRWPDCLVNQNDEPTLEEAEDPKWSGYVWNKPNANGTAFDSIGDALSSNFVTQLGGKINLKIAYTASATEDPVPDWIKNNYPDKVFQSIHNIFGTPRWHLRIGDSFIQQHVAAFIKALLLHAAQYDETGISSIYLGEYFTGNDSTRPAQYSDVNSNVYKAAHFAGIRGIWQAAIDNAPRDSQGRRVEIVQVSPIITELNSLSNVSLQTMKDMKVSYGRSDPEYVWPANNFLTHGNDPQVHEISKTSYEAYHDYGIRIHTKGDAVRAQIGAEMNWDHAPANPDNLTGNHVVTADQHAWFYGERGIIPCVFWGMSLEADHPNWGVSDFTAAIGRFGDGGSDATAWGPIPALNNGDSGGGGNPTPTNDDEGFTTSNNVKVSNVLGGKISHNENQTLAETWVTDNYNEFLLPAITEFPTAFTYHKPVLKVVVSHREFYVDENIEPTREDARDPNWAGYDWSIIDDALADINVIEGNVLLAFTLAFTPCEREYAVPNWIMNKGEDYAWYSDPNDTDSIRYHRMDILESKKLAINFSVAFFKRYGNVDEIDHISFGDCCAKNAINAPTDWNLKQHLNGYSDLWEVSIDNAGVKSDGTKMAIAQVNPKLSDWHDVDTTFEFLASLGMGVEKSEAKFAWPVDSLDSNQIYIQANSDARTFFIGGGDIDFAEQSTVNDWSNAPENPFGIESGYYVPTHEQNMWHDTTQVPSNKIIAQFGYNLNPEVNSWDKEDWTNAVGMFAYGGSEVIEGTYDYISETPPASSNTVLTPIIDDVHKGTGVSEFTLSQSVNTIIGDGLFFIINVPGNRVLTSPVGLGTAIVNEISDSSGAHPHLYIYYIKADTAGAKDFDFSISDNSARMASVLIRVPNVNDDAPLVITSNSGGLNNSSYSTQTQTTTKDNSLVFDVAAIGTDNLYPWNSLPAGNLNSVSDWFAHDDAGLNHGLAISSNLLETAGTTQSRTFSANDAARSALAQVVIAPDVNAFNPDDMPDAFSFDVITNANRLESYTSDVFIQGVDEREILNVSNGLLSNDGIAWSSSIQFEDGNTRVRATVTTGDDFATEYTSVVNVNGQIATLRVVTKSSDATANPFTFDPAVEQEINSEVFAITFIEDVDEGILIGAVGGDLSNDGINWSSTINFEDGNTRVRATVTTAPTYDTEATQEVTVAAQTAVFSATTREADATPDAFSFAEQTGLEIHTSVSSIAFLAGMDENQTASVTNGLLSNDGATWVASLPFKATKTRVKADLTTSSDWSTLATKEVTVNGTSATFNATTRDANTTPDQFEFAAVTEAPASTQYTRIKQITGIDEGQTVAVTGGELSNDGTTWVSSLLFENGNTRVRAGLTSSNQYMTTVTQDVTVNGVTATFSVSTRNEDASPDQFVFVNKTNAELDTDYTNTQFITGLDEGANVSVNNGGLLSNDGETWSGSVSYLPGRTRVRAYLTSSPNYLTLLNVNITVNGISSNFSVTTKAAPPDEIPDEIQFVNKTGVKPDTKVTNIQPLEGVDSGSTLIATGGSLTNNNGQTWSNSVSMVPGFTYVRATVTSSSEFLTIVSQDVTVNGVTATFSVTTGDKDSVKDEIEEVPYSLGDTVYSDFSMNFIPHPVTGDIGIVRDDEAVKQSIRTLVRTHYHDRYFNDKVGSEVDSTNFEMTDEITPHNIQEEIKLLIRNFEPRVDLETVSVGFIEDDHEIVVSIKFYIINNTTPFTLNVSVEKE